MRPQKQLRRAQPPPPRPPLLFEELIEEILSRLPVKSLLRMRCVCKSWKSLISDPYFVKLHLHRSATNTDFTPHRITSVVGVKRSVVSYSARSFLESPSSTIAEEDLCYRLKDAYCVVGSCNGLLCLAGLFVGEIFEEHWVCLWNPSTRLRSEKSPYFYVNWRSDQFISTEYGFGYDHVSDTYKVVAVISDLTAKEDSKLEKSLVQVYSMGDKCWRKIQSFPAVPTIRQNDGVYLSGTLNWLAVCNISYEWHTLNIDQLVIVSLDLGKETSRSLLLPHGLDEVPHVAPTIGVLRGCLCVFHDYKRTHFVVWQMKEFGVEESWTQLVKFCYEDLQTGCLEFRSMLLPLCLSEIGDVLMVSNFAESRAILYKRRDNSLKRSEVLNNINWIHPKLYVESLVLPC